MQSELVTDGRAALLHIECFYEADDAEKRIKAVLAVFDEAERLHKEVARIKSIAGRADMSPQARCACIESIAHSALAADNQEQQ